MAGEETTKKIQPSRVIENETALPYVKRGNVLLEVVGTGQTFQVSEETYLRSFTDESKFIKKKSNTD